MPKKTTTPLPDELRHLQPFVDSLHKLPLDRLNEDLDTSRLEKALRKRFHGLDEAEARTRLLKDREILEAWLKESASASNPAAWVLGYLSLPDLAKQFVQPPVPTPKGPTIAFDPPPGWKVKAVPYTLNLKKGKLIGSITATTEETLDLLQRQRAVVASPPGVKIQATLTTSEVRFGDVRGKKCLYEQTAPVPWKRVDYYLCVPGGFVLVFLDALGADFDEASFEAQAHTLRLSASA